jgi:seryl-tRNA synthetase
MKTAIIATLQLCLVFAFASCQTTIKPPDPAKLRSSMTKLKTAIKKSQDTAAKAKANHVETQKTTDTIQVEQLNLDEKIDELMKQAPPELQAKVKEVQDLSEAQNKRIEKLEGQLKTGFSIYTQLEKDNTEVTAAENDVHRNGEQYIADAILVDKNATDKIRAVESQLWKQKLLNALGIGGAILFVVLAVLGFLAWKAGKFAIKF